MEKNKWLHAAQVIYSRRRSVGLEITAEGTLILRAPYGFSQQRLEQIVEKKKNWIIRAQNRVKWEKSVHKPLEIREGASFLLFGRPSRLHFVPGRGFAVKKDLLLMGQEENRESLCVFLAEEAEKIIRPLVVLYCRKMGLSIPRLKCSRGRSRWGYCNYRGEIGFSWRLVFCPPEVTAYVVVHELCHIRNMSHNQAFWCSVAEILPDYQKREQWLKIHRKVMDTL